MPPFPFFLLLIIGLIILANAFFATVEFALVSARRTWLQQKAAQGDSRAETALHLISNMNKVVSGTQVGITMTSLALGWVGELTLARVLTPILAPIHVFRQRDADDERFVLGRDLTQELGHQHPLAGTQCAFEYDDPGLPGFGGGVVALEGAQFIGTGDVDGLGQADSHAKRAANVGPARAFVNGALTRLATFRPPQRAVAGDTLWRLRCALVVVPSSDGL